uniref:Sulfotransferase family protein n=1 Tax=Rubrivivax gelatinosus S1 TaxID=1138313 RepID=L8BAF9_RUBGE|nr:hypothetical protein RGS1_70355 [Rubrivivax gelatinosus S1]
MRVLFPHLPKCAGTSIRTALETDPRFRADYHHHPTWQCEADRQAGREAQARSIARLREEPSWIVFGHFAPRAYYGLEFDYQILVLREPLARVVSHYYYVRDVLPDNEVTVRRHPEVRAVKDGRMPIEEFVELEHVRHFYGRCYLADLRVDERLVVLPAEQLDATMAAVGSLLGLPPAPVAWMNRGPRGAKHEALRARLHEDIALYESLMSHPNPALARSG